MIDNQQIGSVKPTYKPGYEFKELKECLPEYVVEYIKRRNTSI